MAGGAAKGQGAAEDAAAVVLQRIRAVGNVLVDLVCGQVEGAIGQPGLNLLDAGQGLLPKLTEARTSCLPTSASAPAITPMKPTTVIATAAPLGTLRPRSQATTGCSRPARAQLP